jgi:hypothetical protein
MGFPQGCSEKVTKLPDANVQCEWLLDLLARVVPDTVYKEETHILQNKRDQVKQIHWFSGTNFG